MSENAGAIADGEKMKGLLTKMKEANRIASFRQLSQWGRFNLPLCYLHCFCL